MSDQFGLPRRLNETLLLRWATLADVEALPDFNLRILSDDPENPDKFLADWTRDMMFGAHPTVSAGDFTVVTDESKGGKIVSSLNHISQRWAYDGIEFGCGRVELVGTDPEYRQRGLVRSQMEVVHAKSAARGEMVQAITGIPWFYRLFNYEMALNLGGGRAFFWGRRGNHQLEDEEEYHIRLAGVEDLHVLAELYEVNCSNSLITRVRDDAQWRYEMEIADRDTGDGRDFHLFVTRDDEIVGYVEYRQWGNRFFVRELGVKQGHSWRAISLFLTRMLKTRAEELNLERVEPIDHIQFQLGMDHPVYEALGSQLEKQQSSYAWYLRVAELPGFVQQIAPVLERRLAGSVMAGHTGTLRLNFFRSKMTLTFEKGKLVEIGTFDPRHPTGGDAVFPNLTFLQLMFGYRSLEELDYAWADCGARNPEAGVLLNILFPKIPSNVIGLG